MDLITDVGLVRLIIEGEGESVAISEAAGLALSNGHVYHARVTPVEGGGRFVTLRQATADQIESD
ncbi:MAG: hypothetical protein R3C44_12650 [Chloroflexota bacterium]